jgi:hypothetical protein
MESLGPIYFGSLSMVTATRGSNDPELGDRVRSGKNEYCFVYNAGNSQAIPGLGVIMSGTSGYSVTISSTQFVDPCFGVVKHATLTTGTYGWVVTRGPVQALSVADNSITTGALVVLGSDGKFTARSISTGYLAPAYAKAMDSIGSAASGLIHIY